MHVFDPRSVAGKTRGRFDSVDYVDGLPGLLAHPQPTIVPHGATLLVSGWTVDPATDGPALAVCVLLDGSRPLDARIGIARGDIKAAEKTDEFVGYQLQVPTSILGSGAHELRTFALSTDGSWYESALAGFRLYHHHATATATEPLARSLRMSLEMPCDLFTRAPLPLGVPIRADRWILLRGWTFDAEMGAGAETIQATDDAGRTWSGPATIEDPRARTEAGANDDRVAFEVAVPAAVFGRGRHRVQLTGLDRTGRPYANAIDARFDVIAAERPFPLTARVARDAPRFAARLRIVGDADDADDRGPTTFTAVLPANAPIAVFPRQRLVIEGWALDETDAAADEVFLELSSTWVDLPPRRHPATCAREDRAAGMPVPPVNNAWFRVTFDMPALPGAAYDLALDIVQPGRRAYSRVPLATLTVQ